MTVGNPQTYPKAGDIPAMNGGVLRRILINRLCGKDWKTISVPDRNRDAGTEIGYDREKEMVRILLTPAIDAGHGYCPGGCIDILLTDEKLLT